MATPRSDRLTVTPTSAKPLSITPGSRVLRSPLSDDEIWKRLKQAGFDEESIRQKDKAALVAYIAKLEAEIYDHQHHMGLLILERKELASKFEHVKTSAESSDLLHKRDSAKHLSALAEAKKREENLKKALEVKEECIASLERALHEMRTECAETKVAAESKFSEAHHLMDEAQRKFTEAEEKMRSAESLQAESNRYSHVAERKLQEVESREDDLRRRILSFKSDCDEKEKEILLERQALSERQKGVQQEQERLLEAQSLLNQREELIFSRSRELNRLQKELEDTKVKFEKEHGALHDEKSNMELMGAGLKRKEEELSKRETDLNKKEQELLDFQAKLATREFDEIKKVMADQEVELKARKYDFEAELEMHRKIVENEIETKRRAWELKEVDLKQQEEQLVEREHELEALSKVLGEKDKDLAEMSSILEEKDQRLRVAKEEVELSKTLVRKEKDEIEKRKQDLQKSLDLLENRKRQIDHAKEKLEALKSETKDLSALEVKLKEEIDLVRSEKLELLAEVDKIKAEKVKFEDEWELLDGKKEVLRKEAERITEEKMAISKFIKEERGNLRQEKEAMRHQYNQDLESLAREREQFMNKMVQEHTEWFGKIQQERADFLREIEMQKWELDNLIEKRREEVESYLKEKEKDFEQEKNNELQYISTLKEKAARELEQVSSEMKRLQAERAEINLDREQRNREWAELSNCIEELKIQRDKLQKQRELLHDDRNKIHAQIEELKKLEDLKIISDDIAVAEMVKSDMESNQRKISARKKLKQQAVMLSDSLNPQKVDAKNSSNGFDASSLQKSTVVNPSPVGFSWIKRCSELIFRHSPEKPLTMDRDKPLISDNFNASSGQSPFANDRPIGRSSKGQQIRDHFGEPKVIVEVPPPAGEVVYKTIDFRSETKEDMNEKTVPSFSDKRRGARRKRASGISTNDFGDPLVNRQQNKKLRPENVTDKVILVSEVTCEKADASNILDQENRDHLQSLTSELDPGGFQGEIDDQSNSQSIEILPCSSTVLEEKQVCKGSMEQVADQS